MNRFLQITLVLLLVNSATFAAKSIEAQIQDIREIGSVLAEYTAKKKTTPFSENWKKVEKGYSAVPIICNLSVVKDIPDKLAYPPYSCAIFTVEHLEDYLSKGLGRKVRLPLDDRNLKQRGKEVPVFYTILITKDHFFVSTYFTEPRDNLRKMGKHWYKFQVGLVAVPEKMIEKAIVLKKKKK